jgi:DNA-directed RNA polymerase specialized sigma24 family protein
MDIGGEQQHRCRDDLTDQQLVTLASAGDAGAWDELVDRYAQPVWTTVIGYGLDDCRAAEVCALTWYRCADHLNQLAHSGQVARWLLAAATGECLRQRHGQDDEPARTAPAARAGLVTRASSWATNPSPIPSF